jgi:predicted ArsR family transcriptional regulator
MDARTGLRPGRLGVERALTATVEVLALNGFEPYMAGAQCIRLQNCPFHPLAAKAPELVCGLNHAFVGGVIDGLHADAVEAVLAPAAGECCVEVRRSANDARDA